LWTPIKSDAFSAYLRDRYDMIRAGFINHVRQTWSLDREARRDVNCFTGSQGLRRAALSTSESNAEATHKGISAANAAAVLRA